jgi:pimeloyl-ACP methyl ester carboxylesterase
LTSCTIQYILSDPDTIQDRQPLLLLGGAGDPGGGWRRVVRHLGGRFSAVPVERAMGLGFEAEAARLAGRLPTAAAAVLAHSGGAVVALEAALLAEAACPLVLYEPPVLAGHAPYRQDGLPALVRAGIVAGRPDEAVAAFLRAAGLAEPELRALRASPGWDRLRASAPTFLRALDASQAYRFRAGRFRALRAPVLLLAGTRTAPLHRASVEALRQALPDATVRELPGQGHGALVAAPAAVAEAIRPFLAER